MWKKLNWRNNNEESDIKKYELKGNNLQNFDQSAHV